jgi:hypothetical protein
MGSLQSDGVGAGLAFEAPTSTTVPSKGGRAFEALLRVEVQRAAD